MNNQLSSPPIVHVRLLLALLLALILSVAPAIAAAGKKKADKGEFASTESILRWINDYRNKPTPAKLPAAVKAMSALGVFRDMDTAGIYVGFMAGVLHMNPKQAEKLVEGMFPMPPEDQVAIVRAIAYSDLPDWKDLMLKFTERMPARRVLIDRFITGKLPTLRQMALDGSAVPLDMLWGQYFATGSYDPVLRMVSILEWSKERDNLDRLTVGNMAKLTLATNASRDKALLDMLKASLLFETKETRAVLTEVIDAAETFEFGKVRRDAMAAIELLKVKGPHSARTAAWWGQAGQTVFALGCVAAGVMGQVYMGVPCVVGGALSNVALKYLTPAE